MTTFFPWEKVFYLLIVLKEHFTQNVYTGLEQHEINYHNLVIYNFISLKNDKIIILLFLRKKIYLSKTTSLLINI